MRWRQKFRLQIEVPASAGRSSASNAVYKLSSASDWCAPCRLKAELHAEGLRAFTRAARLATFAAILAFLSAGCSSASKAREQARLAYLAGQRDAVAQMSQQLPQSANVTFIGPVNIPLVPWTPGMTLTQGILATGYNSQVDPIMIFIRRVREEVQIDPARLLGGSDFSLQPGDIVYFQLPVEQLRTNETTDGDR